MADATERTEQALDTQNRVQDDSRPTPESEASLLDLEPAEAAKRILKDWDDSWKDIASIAEEWKVNRARAQGYTGVALIKKQDKAQAYIPYNAKKNVAGLNKAARLKRRLRATLFADPAKAEATPSRDEDAARDEAEVATRILDDLCSEGNLAYTLHAGDAFDLGGDYGSGFIRLWVDESGGGWRPKQIEASPHAVSPAEPFPVDPTTGQPLPVEPVLRYVSEDEQSFVERASEAKRTWLPKLKDETLTGKQVRFLPFGVRDIWEADGVMVGAAVPLGQLKAQFPDIGKWSEDRVAKLVQTRPQRFKDILPAGRKDEQRNKADALVFVCTRYHVQSPLYPQGAYLIAAGADEILHRSLWYDEEHAEPLDIPITQFKQLTEEDNPYGAGVMELLGPGNELRAAMLGAELEHLDRFANRKVFVPMTSTLQPHQFQSPTGTPIPILPGGEPKYEEIPDFPVIVEKMLAFVSADMDDESGLQQSGQGLNPPGVKSGLHAQVILEQVNQALSDMKQNTERALVRGWRIMLQLVRAYFTVPQQIRWFGDDGRYKQQEWTGADLGSTRDVRIHKGSFTQLSPTAKADLAASYVQAGIMNPQELSHVIEGNIGGVFGLQDNPHRMRVRRQIAQWNEGPPKDFQPMPDMAPPMGGPVGGAPGQEPAPPPNPYAPLLAPIFAPVPADDEPQIGGLRAYELGRAMASTKFHRWPEGWQQGLTASYQAARQASQLVDAKQIEAMQKELEGTKEKLQQAQMKLGEAHVSFAGKLAPFDDGQTQAILADAGIQIPPRTGPVEEGEPKLDPVVQLAHERELKKMDLSAAETQAHIKAAADVEKAKIQGTFKMHGEKLAADREKHTADKVSEASKGQGAPTVNIHLPEKLKLEQGDGLSKLGDRMEALHKAVTSPKEIEVVRDKKTGKLTGARVKPKGDK